MSKFFDELMESVQQMDEIVRAHREFTVDALQVRAIHNDPEYVIKALAG